MNDRAASEGIVIACLLSLAFWAFVGLVYLACRG